jgi:hypothetical protein
MSQSTGHLGLEIERERNSGKRGDFYEAEEWACGGQSESLFNANQGVCELLIRLVSHIGYGVGGTITSTAAT